MKKLALALLILAPLPAWAEFPTIEAVKIRPSSNGYDLAVTLKHPDTGWDHYADGWEVLDADGKRLGYRLLAHPHVHEQPFTRSLGGVNIPKGTEKIFIRPHCLVDGWSEQPFKIYLNR
ncbi:hypothetical protein [Profundibacter sp.]